MVVYVVFKATYESFSNDLCYEDGYYDDYYETEVTSNQIIGIYSNYEKAKKVEEEENNKCLGRDEVYCIPYEVED